jgi:MoaA/NifB/PqqE/SkfB family radical SAM enzyme
MRQPKRTQLIEHLPLQFPFSVHVFSSYYCNFRCNYCVHSLSEQELASADFKRQMMPFEIYRRAIDEIAGFSIKPKALIFAGHGEPLTHPNIADMVAYAKRHGAAERIEIVTNGSLLSESLSDELIGAGIDRLRVSLQGITSDDYERVCGMDIDFTRFLENIKYFYSNKRNTNLFVKVIDTALKTPDGGDEFHKIFDPISDTAVVEHLFPFVEQIDHAKIGGELIYTKHGDKRVSHVDICAMPFYMLVILPNGDVTCCCSIKPPIVFGSVIDSSLKDIWDGGIRRDFLRLLIQSRGANSVCAKCTVPDYGMQDGDYLDEYKEKLLNLL